MKKFYQLYATFFVLLFAWSSYRGLSFSEFVSGTWNPKGRQVYHK